MIKSKLEKITFSYIISEEDIKRKYDNYEELENNDQINLVNNEDLKYYLSESHSDTFINKKIYKDYINLIALKGDINNKLFDDYLSSVYQFITEHKKSTIIIEKIKNLHDEIKISNLDYSESLFLFLRTIPFYMEFSCIDFFVDDERGIICINIQEEGKSLSIQLISKNVLEYSFAEKSKWYGIYRRTGKAKLTSHLFNSHFINDILKSIR